MSKLLYCDLTNGKLRRSLGGAEFSFGTIPHIGILALGLRFSRQVGNRHVEIFPEVEEIRALMGPLDERPETGQFSLKIGGGAPVLGTNLTTLLDHNLSAEDLQTALRATTAASAAVVLEDDATFVVTGVADPITVAANTLRPISFVRIQSYEVDGAATQAIRLQRAPFAFTDTTVERVPRAPYVERIQAGGIVDETDYPEIQKITVPIEFNGSYRIRRSDPVRKSKLLGVGDGPEEIAAAMNPTAESVVLADDLDGVFLVDEHPTDPAMLVTFEGSMKGIGQDLLEIEVFDPPPADHWIFLNPQTAMTEEALRDRNLIRRVPVEIHADLQLPDDDTVRPYCLYRGECSIQESIAHNDLGAVHNVNWTSPPDQKVYKPVSEDSLSEGTRFWPFLIGNGADIVFALPHNLNSPRCRVHLRENASGGRDLVPGSDFEVEHDSNNQLTITLLGTYAATPPALEALTGTVQDLTLTSMWLDPVEIPEANVIGLTPKLDAILEELAELRAQAGSGIPFQAVQSGLAGPLTRSLGIVWRVPRARTLPPRPASLLEWRVTAEDLGSTPARPIRLQPAIHDAVVTALPATLPSPTTTKGSVFSVTTDRPELGGLKAGDFVASSGLELFRAVNRPGTSSYYPAAFELTLFETAVNPLEFPVKSTLQLLCGIELMMLALAAKARDRRSACQWSLILEAGVPTADTTPGTPGGNLAAAFANPITLLEQRLILTEIPIACRVGCKIVRAGDGSLTARWIYNGRDGEIETPPTAVPLALRLRLGWFDAENLPADPRGIVAARGLDVGMDGQPDPTLGKLVIT